MAEFETKARGSRLPIWERLSALVRRVGGLGGGTWRSLRTIAKVDLRIWRDSEEEVGSVRGVADRGTPMALCGLLATIIDHGRENTDNMGQKAESR